ncbi:MAG: helix-turn-helix transcriptional regulator, partial [Roseovarius sp.]|nr:helix-turn-helix transcriptional regulator [Roseovarius sp.]
QTGLPACKPAGLELAQHVAQGSGAGNMVVLCSTISLGLRNTHGLIDLLRRPLVLDMETAPTAKRAMQALLHEMMQPRVGRAAMIRALLLQCMIELLRERLEAGDPAVLWIGGLVDPGLWQALRAMLDDPGAPHSLETLAATAGMSRSRFAERFQQACMAPPMAFLRELRLARAAQLLIERRDPVKRIARQVGFESRSAFTRAFTASRGQSPRAFRDGRG